VRYIIVQELESKEETVEEQGRKTGEVLIYTHCSLLEGFGEGMDNALRGA